MRKLLSLLSLFTAAIITLSACGSNTATTSASVQGDVPAVEEPVAEHSAIAEQQNEADVEAVEPETAKATTAKKGAESETVIPAPASLSITNADEFKSAVENDVENTIASLTADFETFKSEINTYKKFMDNTDTIEEFYEHALDVSNALFVRLRKYAADYAQLVVDSDEFSDKYKSLEKIYKVIYDSARDDAYSDIYNGIFSDMYDYLYDGILSDAYDNNEYGEYKDWSKARSKEYSRWSGSRSDLYRAWSDMGSDIYSFYSTIRSDMYKKDFDDARDDIKDFLNDTEKLNKKLFGSTTIDMPELAVIEVKKPAEITPLTPHADTFEGLKDVIDGDVETVIASLETEFKTLKAETDTYKKYCDNFDKVEAFYKKIYDMSVELCIRMREYSVDYATLILNDDSNFDSKYKDADKIYKVIYNSALESVYSDIYNGLLEYMYSCYYNGVLDGAYDEAGVSYSDWSSVSSKEYKLYSGTGSDVYSAYSKAGSEIYSFYNNISSDFFKSNAEDAQEDIDDFTADIWKLKEKHNVN